LTEEPPGRRAALLLRGVPLERKGCVVNDHRATKDLAKTAVWAEDSLGYAREHGQRELRRLLEAVKADVEFQGTSLVGPPGRTRTQSNGTRARRTTC
jgi:hypothetical protein